MSSCFSFLLLLYQITTNLVAYYNKKLFYRSIGQKFHMGLTGLKSMYGQCCFRIASLESWLFQFLEAPCIPCLMDTFLLFQGQQWLIVFSSNYNTLTHSSASLSTFKDPYNFTGPRTISLF